MTKKNLMPTIVLVIICLVKRAFLLYTCTLSHRNGCGSPSRQGWAASPPPPALLADRDHGAGR